MVQSPEILVDDSGLAQMKTPKGMRNAQGNLAMLDERNWET